MVSRRTILSAVVPSLFASFSGCASLVRSNNQPILSCIEIINVDHHSHTVHLRIDYEGEEILSDSHTIEARKKSGPLQHQWVQQNWPDEPGHFRVHMRMDTDSEWVTINSKKESDEYALQIAYWIGGDGNGIPFSEAIDSEEYVQNCHESIAIPSKKAR